MRTDAIHQCSRGSTRERCCQRTPFAHVGATVTDRSSCNGHAESSRSGRATRCARWVGREVVRIEDLVFRRVLHEVGDRNYQISVTFRRRSRARRERRLHQCDGLPLPVDLVHLLGTSADIAPHDCVQRPEAVTAGHEPPVVVLTVIALVDLRELNRAIVKTLTRDRPGLRSSVHLPVTAEPNGTKSTPNST